MADLPSCHGALGSPGLRDPARAPYHQPVSTPEGLRSAGRRRLAAVAFVLTGVVAGVLVAVLFVPAIATAAVGTSKTIGAFEDLPSDLTISPLQQGSRIYASSHGKPVRPIGANRFELCLEVEDVDAAVAELGAPVLVAPADQPWGERMAYVEDPEGTPVMLYAALPGAGP